jgi:hypothetical protein
VIFEGRAKVKPLRSWSMKMTQSKEAKNKALVLKAFDDGISAP